MRQLVLLGRPIDSYEAQVCNRTIVFDGMPIPIRLGKKSLAWMDGELPPAYAGGLHEFQLLLSGILPSLVFDVPSNDILVHTDGGYEVTV